MQSRLRQAFGLLVGLALAQPAVAFPFSYGGRLTEVNGKPKTGTVEITLGFFPVASGGSASLSKTVTVTLSEGVFNAMVELDEEEVADAFGDASAAVYVEVKEGTKAYPRQRVSLVPYALKVPVDDLSLTFDSATGRLKLNAGTPVNGYFLRTTAAGVLSWQAAGGAGAMTAATYDTSGAPGVVDDSDKLGGLAPSAYAPAAHSHGNAELTGLDASKLSGTIADARFSAYDDLIAESKVGTGALQLAAGNHSHTKSDVGLGSVENTALSTWGGTSNVTTLGTIGSGTWNGTAIGDAYIASAATWNAKVSSQWTTSGSDISFSGGKIGLGTTVPFDDFSLYAATGYASLSVGVAGGINDAQLSLLSKSDGTNQLGGLATAKGWQISAYGEAKNPASLRNDLDITYWDGTGWIYPLKIDSLTGNVGIGSSSPNATLDVGGTVKLAAAGTPGSNKVLTSDATGVATWGAPGAALRYADFSLLPASPAGEEVAFVQSNECLYTYSSGAARWEVTRCDYLPNWRVKQASNNTITYYDQTSTARDVAVTNLTAGVTRNYLYGISYASTTYAINSTTPAANNALAIHEGSATSDDAHGPSRIRGKWQKCGYTIASRSVCLPYLGMLRDLGVANGNFESDWARVGRTTYIKLVNTSTAVASGPADVDLTAYTSAASTMVRIFSLWDSPGSGGYRGLSLGPCGSSSLVNFGESHNNGTYATQGRAAIDLLIVPGCASFTRGYRYSGTGSTFNTRVDQLYSYDEDF